MLDNKTEIFILRRKFCEHYNLPRQLFPKAYQPNGYVEIFKTDLFIKSRYKNLHGDKIMPFLTQNVGEIDSIEDLDYINYLLEKKKWRIYDYLKKWRIYD